MLETVRRGSTRKTAIKKFNVPECTVSDWLKLKEVLNPHKGRKATVLTRKSERNQQIHQSNNKSSTDNFPSYPVTQNLFNLKDDY